MTRKSPRFELSVDVDEDDLQRVAQQNRNSLMKAYKARCDGIAQDLLDLLDPSVVFRVPESLPFGGTEKGLSGVIKGIGEMFTIWDRLSVEFEQFVAGGDLVIGYFRMAGVTKGRHEKYDHPGCAVFRFRNGKIIEWRTLYWDTHRLLDICASS